MRDDFDAIAAISGRDLILSLAQEMRSLRDLARDLPVGAATLDHERIVAAQNQDLVEQTLEELALFLARSAEAFGTEPLAGLDTALSQIRLAALAGRLSGSKTLPADTEGEPDFF